MNKERKIILCRGIQASGKTTFAKNWVLEDPENRVRFNNGDVRNMLGKYWVTSREKLVSNIKDTFITQSMRFGYDIVIDNMNLNPKEVAYYENYVDNYNTLSTYKPFNDDLYHYTIEYEDFFIPLETCIFRDSFRDSPIGKEIITNTYNKYKDIINEHNK